MMLRKSLAVFAVLSLGALLIAFASRVDASGRTLHPNELWSMFGGTTFDERLCDEIGLCVTTKACEDNDSDSVDCRLFGRDDDQMSTNTLGCNFTGDPSDECTEEGQVICLQRWRCKWEEGECVRDTNPQITNNPDDKYAPESCEDNS